MKMRVLAVLITGCLLPVSAFAAETAREAEKKIMEYETALGQAMIHRDLPVLARLVADDWKMQSSSGTVSTKTGFLTDVTSGALQVKRFQLHDVHIHVVGDLAYVMASDDEESSYQGQSHTGTYNWMDVWERRQGRWVSVATQLTEVAAKR